MSFDVAAKAYDGFMGRYSRRLSAQMADIAAVRHGQRILDVGCGTGALTSELVRCLGPSAVSAFDPSAPFVDAMRARFPGVDVQRAQRSGCHSRTTRLTHLWHNSSPTS